MDLVIYDKTYQMSAEELTEVSYEDNDAGVLRFECRLLHDPLRKVMEKNNCKTTRELLKHLIAHSEEMMPDYFSRCFAGDDFCLDRFEEPGVSPIPLWKSFCAERLPSPVTLLKGISAGEIPVDYVLIK